MADFFEDLKREEEKGRHQPGTEEPKQVPLKRAGLKAREVYGKEHGQYPKQVRHANGDFPAAEKCRSSQYSTNTALLSSEKEQDLNSTIRCTDSFGPKTWQTVSLPGRRSGRTALPPPAPPPRMQPGRVSGSAPGRSQRTINGPNTKIGKEIFHSILQPKNAPVSHTCRRMRKPSDRTK